MENKIPVSVLVATLNEERNLARCLAALEPFDEIIVIDSNSADRTVEIARSFGVHIVDFTWNGRYPKKRQWVLDTLSLKHDRVFFVDADEEVTPELCDEIAALDWQAAGYFVRGRYVVDGHVLQFGVQNKKLCLFDRRKIAFPVVDDLGLEGMGEIEGHYQPVLKEGFAGKIAILKNAVLHHALEDRARYAARHEGYARWRAGMEERAAFPQDPVARREWLKNLYRKAPCKSLLLYLYFYVGRLGFLERKKNAALFREKRKYHAADRKRA